MAKTINEIDLPAVKCPVCGGGLEGDDMHGQRCIECGWAGEDVGNVDLNACPSCGAPEGEECDPDCHSREAECPVCHAPDGVACDCRDAARTDLEYDRRMEGSRDFNKFMDRILVEEKRPEGKVTVLNDSPQRQLAARYQERPMGRTRMGGKRS